MGMALSVKALLSRTGSYREREMDTNVFSLHSQVQAESGLQQVNSKRKISLQTNAHASLKKRQVRCRYWRHHMLRQIDGR